MLFIYFLALAGYAIAQSTTSSVSAVDESDSTMMETMSVSSTSSNDASLASTSPIWQVEPTGQVHFDSQVVASTSAVETPVRSTPIVPSSSTPTRSNTAITSVFVSPVDFTTVQVTTVTPSPTAIPSAIEPSKSLIPDSSALHVGIAVLAVFALGIGICICCSCLRQHRVPKDSAAAPTPLTARPPFESANSEEMGKRQLCEEEKSSEPDSVALWNMAGVGTPRMNQLQKGPEPSSIAYSSP